MNKEVTIPFLLFCHQKHPLNKAEVCDAEKIVSECVYHISVNLWSRGKGEGCGATSHLATRQQADENGTMETFCMYEKSVKQLNSHSYMGGAVLLFGNKGCCLQCGTYIYIYI